jgi:hypothetical protein
VTNSNRENIHEAIKALGPMAEGDVPGLAMKLSSTFQQSGMTLQMIEEEIHRLRSANTAGAPAEKAERPGDGEVRPE